MRAWLVVFDRVNTTVKLNRRVGQKYHMYKQNNVTSRDGKR